MHYCIRIRHNQNAFIILRVRSGRTRNELANSWQAAERRFVLIHAVFCGQKSCRAVQQPKIARASSKMMDDSSIVARYRLEQPFESDVSLAASSAPGCASKRAH